jgi:hypothetical protein
VGDTTSLVPGYPIRTSSDPRSVDNSPRHIAASHVLHRPLMPRHPPCALTHLHTKKHSTKSTQRHTAIQQRATAFLLDARNHYPTLKHHTPPPKRGDNRKPPNQRREATPRRGCGPAVSKPNSVPNDLFAGADRNRSLITSTFVVAPTSSPLQAPARSHHVDPADTGIGEKNIGAP